MLKNEHKKMWFKLRNCTYVVSVLTVGVGAVAMAVGITPSSKPAENNHSIKRGLLWQAHDMAKMCWHKSSSLICITRELLCGSSVPTSHACNRQRQHFDKKCCLYYIYSVVPAWWAWKIHSFNLSICYWQWQSWEGNVHFLVCLASPNLRQQDLFYSLAFLSQ